MNCKGKKCLSLLFVCLFAFSLCACGKRKDPNDPGNTPGDVKKIYIDGGGDIGNFNSTPIMQQSEANPFPYNTLEKLCEEWEKLNPGYDVVIQPTSAGGDRGVLVPQLSQDVAADIVYQSGTVIYTDLGKGYYVDLTDALMGKNKYAPEFDSWLDIYGGEALAATDGRYYMVQLERIPVGIMYNKKIFAELGLSVPETFAEFLSVCDAVNGSNKYDAYSTTYTWYDIVLESNIFSSILDKVDVLRKDGKVDTEEMVRAYEKGIWSPQATPGTPYYEYIRLCKEKTKRYPKNWQSYDAVSNFATGKLAMIEATGKEMRKFSVNKAIDFEWSVMPFPYLTTESTEFASTPVVRGSAGLATSWFVTSSAVKKGTEEACIDLLQFLTAPKNNNRLIGDLKGGIPLNPSSDYELASYIEPLIDIYNQDMEAKKRGERVSWGAFCSWEVLGYDFNTTFIRTLQDIDNGVKSVDDGVKYLVTAIRGTVQGLKVLNKENWDTTSW